MDGEIEKGGVFELLLKNLAQLGGLTCSTGIA